MLSALDEDFTCSVTLLSQASVRLLKRVKQDDLLQSLRVGVMNAIRMYKCQSLPSYLIGNSKLNQFLEVMNWVVKSNAEG